jgi:hypothetical protein
MIAPIRDTDSEDSRLREARQTVASLLPARSPECGPAVPAWQAWLLVAWALISGAVFLSAFLGRWK